MRGILCDGLARAAAGTYEAWISDSNAANGPSNRFTGVGGNFLYKLPTGTVIANGWTDLTNGSLAAPIDRDENSNLVSAASNVWTNVSFNGSTYDTVTSGQTNHCVDWTSGASNKKGHLGSSNATGVTWSDTSGSQGCDVAARLYCFEQ